MTKPKLQQLQPPLTPIEIACLSDEAIISAAEAALLFGCAMAKLQRWQKEGLADALVSTGASTELDEYRLGEIRRWWAATTGDGRISKAAKKVGA